MKSKFIFRGLISSYLLASSVLFAESSLNSSPSPHPITSEWKHQIMLYGWVPLPSSSLKISTSGRDEGEPEEPEEPEVPSEPGEESQSNIADNIDFLFMGVYRLEKDRYLFQLDGVYLGMSGDKTYGGDKNSVNFKPSMKAWIAAMYGGYNLINNDKLRFDVIAGIRYTALHLDLKASADLDFTIGEKHIELDKSGAWSKDFDVINGVIGIDGTGYITKNWFVPYHFDIGLGDSKYTYRASTGLGYGFGWGDVLLSYRYLHHEFSDSKLLNDLTFAGPLLGVNFRF